MDGWSREGREGAVVIFGLYVISGSGLWAYFAMVPNLALGLRFPPSSLWVEGGFFSIFVVPYMRSVRLECDCV